MQIKRLKTAHLRMKKQQSTDHRSRNTNCAGSNVIEYQGRIIRMINKKSEDIDDRVIDHRSIIC